MADLTLLLEAEKRGILPEDKKPLLAEARKRGLVPNLEPAQVQPEPSTVQIPTIKEIGTGIKTGIEQVGQYMEPVVRGTAEMIGTMGGPISSALGYAGTKRAEYLADLARGKVKQETLPESFMQTGKDLMTGAEIGMGGKIVSGALSGLLAKYPKLEEDLYNRVAKFSTTLKPAEKAKRINTALNERLNLTPASVAKSKAKISDINDEIQSKISEYGRQGYTADLENIVGKAEAMRQNKITGKLLTPEVAQAQTSDVIEEAMRSAGEKIPVQQAQTFKQNLNKELDDFYKALQTTPDKTTFLAKNWTMKTKAALADGLRQEISNIFPEVTALNQREAALIQLNKSLERAVNRISNHELLSLKGIASMIHSPKWFVTNYILNNPTVQSSLAIAIRQARNKGISPTIEATTKGIATFSTSDPLGIMGNK